MFITAPSGFITGTLWFVTGTAEIYEDLDESPNTVTFICTGDSGRSGLGIENLDTTMFETSGGRILHLWELVPTDNSIKAELNKEPPFFVMTGGNETKKLEQFINGIKQNR